MDLIAKMLKEKQLRMSYLGIDTDNSSKRLNLFHNFPDSLTFQEIYETFNQNQIDVKIL